MEVEILEVAGIEPAIKAMRLPMKSGVRSDSGFCVNQRLGIKGTGHCFLCRFHRYDEENDTFCDASKGAHFVIGPKDYDLSEKLIKAGSDHRKHLRLIDAWLKITAPRYWWSEFDTYRHGVDKVSESTMHRILKDKITLDDFSEGADELVVGLFAVTVKAIKENDAIGERDKLNKVKAILPESYLQTRVVKCSYEALRNMYQARKNHRLYEWEEFCDAIEILPYSGFITEDFEDAD